MKEINLTVSGKPTDVPELQLEGRPAIYHGSLEQAGRCVFTIPDTEPSPFGMVVRWKQGSFRILAPPPMLPTESGQLTGQYEGSELGMQLAAMEQRSAQPSDFEIRYGGVGGRLSVTGDRFLMNGQRFYVRGATAFRLPQLLASGTDLTPFFEQYRRQRVNWVRCVAMKANNTGWEFHPKQQGDYWGHVHRFCDRVAKEGLMLQWTVFCDTALLMADANEQMDFWLQTIQVVTPYRDHITLDEVNEWSHSTQRIDPVRFPRPEGVLASRGSGQTDEAPVPATKDKDGHYTVWLSEGAWDWAGWHGRRDGARGFTNYDPYEFRAAYPSERALLCEEGAKPENHGFNEDFARLQGLHAACGNGALFHTSEGVNGQLWQEGTERCAGAFFDAIPN